MSDNIASALAARARERPDAVAMIQTWGIASGSPRERKWTFRELDDETDRVARGLMRLGIGRGTRAALMVPPTPEFFALTFGLFKLGAVVVLIDPGMGVANLGTCLAEAEPEAFIGVPKAHLGRLLFGWARKSVRKLVTVGGWRLWGGWSLDRVRREGDAGGPVLADADGDDPAAVLFTSGSTGVAKGVVYTHAIFGAQVRALRDLYGIRPGEVDVPTFPLFGLFGPALGMTTVLPEMDATRPAHVNPDAIFNAVERYSATNLFGSPALLRRVAFSKQAETRSMPSLRRVLSAGAPVPAVVLRQTERLLAEGVPIYTPYGATEALPVSNVGHREILDETAGLTTEGRGVCVGRPVGVDVRIIGVTDEPIETWSDDLLSPPGEVGEVTVRGPVVTRTYYGRPADTARHKIVDGATFWHRMGDVGYVDERGRLWFCGRKSHRVVTAHGTLYTIPVEGVFNAHPAVLRTALVGVPATAAVREPVLCVELDPEAGRGADPELVLRQLREIGAQHEHTRGVRRMLLHPGFPVDVRHNAKIFREKLAVWASAALGAR